MANPIALAAIKIISQTEGVEKPPDYSLADQIELAYLHRPNALKRRVLLYAILGNSVLWWWIMAAIIGPAFLLLFLICGRLYPVIIVLVVYLWFNAVLARMRKYLVPMPDPTEGYEVTRKEFPALFAHLDGVSARMKAPRLGRFWLIYFNATHACETDVLIGSAGHIGIEISLFSVLSVPEITSIFAHEIAHAKGGHDAFQTWYYQLKWRWQTMTRYGSWTCISWFWKWYWPLFDAHELALERLNERYADRLSAEVVGGNVMSSGYIRSWWSTYVGYQYLYLNEDSIGTVSFDGLLESAQRGTTREAFENTLRQVLPGGRHYALYVPFKDRLSLYSPQFDPFSVGFPQPEPTAAMVFLKDKLPQIYQVLEKDFDKGRQAVAKKD